MTRSLTAPHSLNMERAVLGAILSEPNAIAKVVGVLEVDAFFDPHHKAIYSAALSVFDRTGKVDVLTVIDELTRQGTLSVIGGEAYVVEVSTAAYNDIHVVEHARIVRELSIRRQMIEFGRRVYDQAYDDSVDGLELLEEAERKLVSIGGGVYKSDPSKIGTVVQHVKSDVESIRLGNLDVVGTMSGFWAIDDVVGGFSAGTLIVVAGRPSMGKTALALNVARNVSKRDAVGFFSLEMTKRELGIRLLASESDVEFARIRTGRMTSDEYQKVLEAVSKAQSELMYVDDTPSISLYELKAKVKRLVVDVGIKGVIVDYLQLMKAPRADNRVQAIGELTRGLKALAKELGIFVIVLSQLSRALESRSDNQKIPVLSDLRESGDIEQDADVVIFVHRPEYYGMTKYTTWDGQTKDSENVAEVIIAKNRNGQTGKREMVFLKKRMMFQDVAGRHVQLSVPDIGIVTPTPDGGANEVTDELPF